MKYPSVLLILLILFNNTNSVAQANDNNDGPPTRPRIQGPQGNNQNGARNNNGAGQQRPAPTPPHLTILPPTADQQSTPANGELRALISNLNIVAMDTSALNLPDINDEKAQLGKQLFFTKNLGGEQSAACVSCHHPMLGGGDALSLSVGVDAVDVTNQTAHNLLGHGRFNGANEQNLPEVPRNAPSVFNLGLTRRALFWDGRVERLPGGGIATPDSELDVRGRRQADDSLSEDTTLAAAQAGFPLTSEAEMRDEFLPDIDNQSLRSALALRFDNSDVGYNSTWPQAFELANGDQLVDFARIADALGEYERSMVFVNNPWQAYLTGDNEAITEQQKQGALLFFSPRQQGGAGCAACHNGPTFSDSRQHLVAFPQIGSGKGDNSGAQGVSNTDDFGREQVTGIDADRYHFRTPSLLNVAVTAPYGHSGAYQELTQVVRHYIDPQRAVNTLFAARNGQTFSQRNAPLCQLPQLEALTQKNNLNCAELYPDAYANSLAAVQRLQQAQDGDIHASAPLAGNVRLNAQEVGQIVAFMQALTDPCVEDRNCMQPWIIDGDDVASFPDDQALVATNEEGTEL